MEPDPDPEPESGPKPEFGSGPVVVYDPVETGPSWECESVLGPSVSGTDDDGDDGRVGVVDSVTVSGV